MDITVTEIMGLADLQAHAKITDGTPAEQLPRNVLQCRMQQIVSHVFGQDCELTAARLEIASLRERVQMLGQLARDVNSRRVLELEAQLEAVQEGRDIQGDIDRYNENTMTDTKQPEALRLAAMQNKAMTAKFGKEGFDFHVEPDTVIAMLDRIAELDAIQSSYDAARLEIESLQAQAQQCGAGAGCCAQAARIAELEAQLEAVATPAQPLHVAAINCPHEIDKDRVVLHYDSKQPGKNALAQLAARLQAAQAQQGDTV